MGYLVSKLIKLVVLVMLVSTIACNELPELTRLMDNPSNDFTFVSTASADVRVAAVAAQVTATLCMSRAALPPEFLQDAQRESAAFGSARDLLALLSLLRT